MSIAHIIKRYTDILFTSNEPVSHAVPQIRQEMNAAINVLVASAVGDLTTGHSCDSWKNRQRSDVF